MLQLTLGLAALSSSVEQPWFCEILLQSSPAMMVYDLDSDVSVGVVVLAPAVVLKSE